MVPLYYHVPFFSVVLLMMTGILTSLIHSGKAAMTFHLAMCALLFGANLYLLFNVTARQERFTYAAGILPHPWGNELCAGPLETALALTFLLVMALCVLGGSKGIFEDISPEKQNLYFIMCDLVLASLMAMCYTNDAFTAYVFIEINTISACALVMAKDCGPTLVATLRYLMMSLLGSGMFLMGLTFLYHITGHLLLINIHEQMEQLMASGTYLVPVTVVMGLMTMGMCLKSALFPFHTWLPDAHGTATTASSAILSGLVLKGYVVLLIKVIFCIFGEANYQAFHASDILLVLGVGAMIVGSVKAMQETHIKRMIAYSSVAQIGYIYLGLGLGGAAVTAAVYQVMVHAFTKPLLFVCAGELAEASGHRKQMYYLRGAAHRAKLAGIGFTIGALSMIGLPLLGGFAVKFFLADAALDSGWRMWLALAALAASSVLNALYYLPAVIQIWTLRDHGEDDLPKLPRTFAGPAVGLSIVLLAAGSLLLGVCCAPVGRLISLGLGLM